MSSNQLLVNQLQTGIASLKIEVDHDQLLDFLHLLYKWNKTYNLTAIRDMETMVNRHILDSLALCKDLHGLTILDVGSGGGLPGIPLAIANPDKHFFLLDSNGKKTRFLEEVKRNLDLRNVEIIQSRVESYHPKQPFDTVISRAFSDLAQMLVWTKHLVTANGIWIATKGRYPDTELAMISLPFQVNVYQVPGLEGERCSVIIKNVHEE